MAKTVIQSDGRFTLERIQEVLSKQHACYVLITCTEPNQKGEMGVQLFYEGDESLASYLIDQAQDLFAADTDHQLESK